MTIIVLFKMRKQMDPQLELCLVSKFICESPTLKYSDYGNGLRPIFAAHSLQLDFITALGM